MSARDVSIDLAPVPASIEAPDSFIRLALLAAIVESSDDAIVSKTLDGRILSWNAGASRIFGYTAAEAIGQLITMIIPPELRGEEQRILDQVRRGERIDHFDTISLFRDKVPSALITLQIFQLREPIRTEHHRGTKDTSVPCGNDDVGLSIHPIKKSSDHLGIQPGLIGQKQ